MPRKRGPKHEQATEHIPMTSLMKHHVLRDSNSLDDVTHAQTGITAPSRKHHAYLQRCYKLVRILQTRPCNNFCLLLPVRQSVRV